MFRDKDVDLDKAINQLRFSEIAVQQIQDIEKVYQTMQYNLQGKKPKKNREGI